MKKPKSKTLRTLRFPLLKGAKDSAPGRPACAWCKKPEVGEPFDFVLLSAGCPITDGPPVTGAYFQVWWHGAHSLTGETTGKVRYVGGDNPEARILIADHVDDGQFDVLFCSTACLRHFFNHVVDQLDACKARELGRAAKRVTYRHGQATPLKTPFR